MKSTNRCRQCQIELGKVTSEGLCPKCLLRVGLEVTGDQPIQAAADTGVRTESSASPSDSDSNPPVISLTRTTESAQPGSRVRYFGDYELIDEIARGGMGVVYKARQSTLNRIVALKMILSGELAGEQEVKRFYVEAESAAKLDHPNIVPIFEIGHHQGQHYFSMAFVQGESLAHIVSAGPLSPKRAAMLIKQIAVAVSYAHVEGVVHRDLKPANVIVDNDGQPRITDFGLAKRIDCGTSKELQSNLTATAQVLGTPGYMAPEQAAGHTEKIGAPADIYSLGATLYCLLTGRPPFQSASPVDTILQVIERDPVPVRQLVPSVPKDLETICLKCLEKEPSRRYERASNVADDLERFLNGETIRARPTSRIEKTWRWCRRNPLVSGLAAALMVMIALGSFFGTSWALNESSLRQIAELRQKKSELREKASREALYVAEFKLAKEAWEQTDIDAARRGLDALQPASGMQDLRGWEWFYLKELWNRSYLTVQSRDAMATSPTSSLLAVAGRSGMKDEAADAMNVDAIKAETDFLSLDTSHSIIVFYDFETGERRSAIATGSSQITAMDFSPDGKKIATGGSDSVVNVWNVESGTLLATLEGHLDVDVGDFLSHGIRDLKWSPDATHIISGDQNGNVFVWNVKNQEHIAQLTHSTGVSEVGWDSEGKQAFAIDPLDSISIWNTQTWKPVLLNQALRSELFELISYSARWSPDGSRIAFAGIANDLQPIILIWNTQAEEAFSLVGHTEEVVSVAWSHDGKKLVSGSYDKTVRIWDTSTGQLLQTYTGHADQVDQVAWSHDARWAISRGENTKVWDTQKNTDATVISQTSGSKQSISWSASGDQIVVGDTVWNNDGTKAWRIPEASGLTVWSPDGKFVATKSDSISDQGMQQIHVWDASTHQRVATLAGHRGSIHNLVWSADSTRVASTSLDVTIQDSARRSRFESDQAIRVWNVASESELFSLKVEDDSILCLAWSPDGQNLVWAEGNRLKVLSTNDSRDESEFETAGLISSLNWSPDNQHVVVGYSSKGTVDVWNVPAGTKSFELNGHAGGTNSVDWSSDMYRIATAGADGTVRVWDTRTHQEMLRFVQTTFKRIDAYNVHWSPNGKHLAACQDGEFRIWSAAVTNSRQ